MSDAKRSGAGHVFSSSTRLREQGREIHAAMPLLHLHLCFTSMLCWLAHESSSLVLPNATELLSPPSSTRTGPAPGAGMPRSRRRRYLSPRDMNAILDYHNQVRAQVSPPAANMEYMVWDERLARAAEAWAARCVWEHGPPQLMKYVGQNLSIHSGRYRSVVDMVRSWHHEQQHYSFPHPRECNPRCPSKCSGSVCSHYTQGQLDWGSAVQDREAMLSLPACLRRGLLQQHVLHRTQIQPSELVLGWRQRSTSPRCTRGDRSSRIIYGTTMLLSPPQPSPPCAALGFRRDTEPALAPVLSLWGLFLDTPWDRCCLQLLHTWGALGVLGAHGAGRALLRRAGWEPCSDQTVLLGQATGTQCATPACAPPDLPPHPIKQSEDP
uniref:R3H domain containing like n=1 Tax=Pavo cristatus TaxID=9049 RepID=A0A8C9FBE4_PAVCR